MLNILLLLLYFYWSPPNVVQYSSAEQVRQQLLPQRSFSRNLKLCNNVTQYIAYHLTVIQLCRAHRPHFSGGKCRVGVVSLGILLTSHPALLETSCSSLEPRVRGPRSTSPFPSPFQGFPPICQASGVRVCQKKIGSTDGRVDADPRNLQSGKQARDPRCWNRDADRQNEIPFLDFSLPGVWLSGTSLGNNEVMVWNLAGRRRVWSGRGQRGGRRYEEGTVQYAEVSLDTYETSNTVANPWPL